MLKKILSTAAAMSVFFNMTFALPNNFQAYTPVFAEDTAEASPSPSAEPEQTPSENPETPAPSPTRTPRPVRTPRPTDDPDAPAPSLTPTPTMNTDLSAGDIIIYENGTYEIENVKSSNHIIVKDNVTEAEIVLFNTEIISDSPVQIGSGCGVILAYDGTNIIESTSNSPAVLIPEDSQLILEGSGSLDVSSAGAAIGSDKTDSGSITINSGTLTVRSTGGGAAVGGGNNKNASNITINGGTIEAYAVNGAAVGGGSGGGSKSISITGGTLSASSEKGAAVGGGSGGDSESIIISGGTISASSEKGAAIGGGSNGESKNISITGGTIEALCGSGCAAIGGGYKKSGGNISVSGGKIVGYAGEYGRILGSGRYCVSGKVNISGGADISGFVKEGACAVDEAEVSGTSAMICAFYKYDAGTRTTSDPPDFEQTVKFSCGTYSDTLILPSGYYGFIRTLEKTGTYSLTTGAGDPIEHLVYKTASSSSSSSSTTLYNSSRSKEYAVSAGLNHFILSPSDACYLEEPEFKTEDIVLTRDQIGKTVRLSTYSRKVTPITCSSSAHKSQAVTYNYEIVEDVSKIASLDKQTLKVNVTDNGVYQIALKITAVCGDLSAEKIQVVNVLKQGSPHNMKDEDLNITQNGVYTVQGSSTRYNINVAAGLDDVNIIANSGINIDMSKNTTSRKSPIVIGDNSKVSLTSTSSITLKSTDNGSCIEGGKNSAITISGNSTSLNLQSFDDGNCITGGDVYILGGNVHMSAKTGDVIKADNLFVSDSVKTLSAWSENSKNYPFNAKYITAPYQSHNPAYIVQGKLSAAIGEDNSSISARRTTTVNTSSSKYSSTSKSASSSVSGISKDGKAFAVKVSTYGNYKVSFSKKGASLNDYTIKDGKRNIEEITLEEEKTYMASNVYSFNECKCKLSAPTFTMEKIILPYEKRSASYRLDADGAALSVDKDCREHTSSSKIYYNYSIDEDKDDIASISDERINFSVPKPGKYTVKVTAEASIDGITASKSISISVTRLSEEETTKQRGELHSAYINGYDDDTFRPDNNITRAEAATILTSALDIDDNYKEETSFFDVSLKAWYYDAVLAAEQSGIFSGYEDGSFKPDNNITRAEFTVAVCNAFGIEIKSSASKSKSKMEDINEHWSRSYVDALVKTKYINGYNDGTFKPDNNITRAEAVAILNRAMSRTVSEDKVKQLSVNNPFDDIKKNHWAYYDIMEAVNAHYANEWHK